MASDKRQAPSGVTQLIIRGMQRQGIPSWRKLEELCDVSYGYLQHLSEGHIGHPKEETLRRLAHLLGQRVEEYRAALLADRNELPDPVYYFSAHLGQPVQQRDADLAMDLLEELVRRRPPSDN